MLKFGGSSPGVMYIYDNKLSSKIKLGESIMSKNNYSRDGGYWLRIYRKTSFEIKSLLQFDK